MALRNIIVIGGSTGATEVLKTVVGALPADLSASVFVSTHLASHLRSYLPEVLGRLSRLPVQLAEDGAAVEPGRIYVAAPGHHLLLLDDRIRFGSGPRENMARPAIDALFRSAALTYGPRTVGVLLSGMLNDGASGLLAIRDAGGLAVVQDPAEAEAPDMPRAACALMEPDHLVRSESIAPLLAALTGTEAPAAPPASQALRLEVEIAAGGRLGSDRLRELADPAPLTCPDCQGVLSEIRGARPRRFRCQTGHAVTAEILDCEQDAQVEEALRVAMRIMEERIELITRMARDASTSGRSSVADLYSQRASEFRRYGDVLRKAVMGLMDSSDAATEANDDAQPEADEGEKTG